MGATATLSTSHLAVEPGQEVTCPVIIRNAGMVVDQFAIDVVGASAGWAVAEPSVVNLMPGESVTVTVRFAPPVSADVLADSVPFGIRVTSHEDPAGSVVEEGVVVVAPFTAVTAEVVPAKAEGARRANFEVAIDNNGNHPAGIRLDPADPEDDLTFWVQRSELTLSPGTAAFVRLRARPRRRFLRGAPRPHPFRVHVAVDQHESIVAEATMVQRQLLPKWLVPLLIALLAFVLALVTLYFTVLRPTINSAARAEVAAQTGQLAAAASSAQQQASKAAQQASSAQQAAGGGGGAAGSRSTAPAAGGGGGGAGGAGGNATANNGQVLNGGTATDFRIEADTTITAGNATSFTTFKQSPVQPANTTLAITDIILQNPFGDSGLLRIQRGSSGDILFEIGLANFRDLDYHFVQALVFSPDQPLEVSVNCQATTAGPNDGKCHPAVSFSGRLITNTP